MASYLVNAHISFVIAPNENYDEVNWPFLYNIFIHDVLRFGELHVVFVSISQGLFMVVIKYYYLCNMFVTMATKGQTQTLLSVKNHYAITTLKPIFCYHLHRTN